MPLSQDPFGGGTEADGRRSVEYCSFCYQNGTFVHPEQTLPEFIATLEGIMSSMDMAPELVESTKAVLPTLKRWRQN